MKKEAHPKYFTDAKAICACGNTFTVGSTQKEIHIEICSNCHPFYTGKQKLVDSARRIEKFEERAAKQKETAAKRTGKQAKKAKQRTLHAKKKAKADKDISK